MLVACIACLSKLSKVFQYHLVKWLACDLIFSWMCLLSSVANKSGEYDMYLKHSISTIFLLGSWDWKLKTCWNCNLLFQSLIEHSWNDAIIVAPFSVINQVSSALLAVYLLTGIVTAELSAKMLNDALMRLTVKRNNSLSKNRMNYLNLNC